MNRKGLLTCLLLCLACSAAWAEKVTLSKAKQIASPFIKAGSSMSLVKSMTTTQDDEALPIYVFSRGEGEGFVIVSGDDALTPIIGYTEEGNFDEDNIPPFLQQMMDYYSQSAQLLWAGQTTPVAYAPARASGQNIATLMTTHWHQSWPYNNLCPYITGTTNRAATGCVATAASQIIYYWRKDLDDRTQYNTPTYDYGDAPVTESIPSGTPLKWDLMQDSYSGSEPEECTTAVATFVACVGASGWLTYGSSTSGQISEQLDMLNRQFGLNGSCVWKSGYSQSKWESMIIEDLEDGCPILYSGVNPSSGGHAVVIDGYQASTNLFHFNFGWGNGYDGYFTVDDTNGMNGFNESQGMVWNIYPKSPKVTGELTSVPEQFISRVESTITAKITNNSTLAKSGYYIYCLTGNNYPSSSSATDSDTKTVIEPGSAANLTFSFTPSGTSTYTVYLTDANKNILDKVADIDAVASVADLTLNSMAIDDGGESETLTVDGKTVEVKHVFNSKKANVTTNFTNGGDGTLCTPSIQGIYYKYTDGSFVQAGTKTKRTTTFETGGTEDVVFDLTGLTDGEIYKFTLSGTASTNRSFDINYATADTVIYFKLVGSNLVLTPDESGDEVKVTGNYNEMVFSSLATDTTISRYDMTSVVALSAPLEAGNKNALFYVDASQQVAGTNVIVDNVCDNLDLTPGYNFLPREDFSALSATYHATQAVGLYGTAYLPFDAETPTGMFARKVNVISTQYLNDVDTCNLEMKGGTPYIILTGEPIDITAKNADISINTPSLCTDTMRGTWKNMVATDTQWVLDDADTQYFNTYTGNVIPALTAYLEYTRKVRVTSREYYTKDSRARQLAQQIEIALEVYSTYADVTSSAAKAEFMAVIDEAREKLSTQPVTSEQNAQINALEEAAETYIASVTTVADNGYVDKTSYISNPSFEQGNTRSWTTSSASVQKITSSLSNYMAHADGNYVVYMKAQGNSVQQTLTGIENGVYQLVASVAADYGNHITLFAGDLSVTVEATDFGPMYLEDAVVDEIEVKDNTLNIGVSSVDGWAKADNFRLYQISADTTPVVSIAESVSVGPKGIYDLSGRRLNDIPAKGIYIIDGKKVIVQ